MRSYLERLDARTRATGTVLCLGLDPDPDALPDGFSHDLAGVERFAALLLDAAAPVAAAVKPNLAFFEAFGSAGLAALERLRATIPPDIPVIADAKRGDIGSTAEHYAREAFTRYGAHAVTVNPYLGGDSVMPYFALGGAVIALCRTSNPGSADLQSLDCGGEPLYVRVARMVADQWVQHGECGLVVGATFPGELAVVRDVVGDLPILVPGVGAQHGDAAAAVRAGATADGRGLIVSSSRSILYASSADDFAAAARAATIEARMALAPATAR
jgi:orotidine-5'-phosphate decarboxylase